MWPPKPPSPSEARQVTAWRLRPWQPADVPAVAALSRAVFDMPWSETHFAHEVAANDSRGWVAVAADTRGSGQVVGVVVLWVLPPEAEIATLAVHPAWQRQGIGRALLEHALAWACTRADARVVLLEVRADNRPALHLYRALGFVEVGRRRGYYITRHGRVDALIMRRPCGPLWRPSP